VGISKKTLETYVCSEIKGVEEGEVVALGVVVFNSREEFTGVILN
jgi:hypothetical protein